MVRHRILVVPNKWLPGLSFYFLASTRPTHHYHHLPYPRRQPTQSHLDTTSTTRVLGRHLATTTTTTRTTTTTANMSTTSTTPPDASASASANESNEIRTRKQALRKEIRAKVSALTPDEIATQSEQVWKKLFALPEYQSAKSVGLFLSMPKNEIKTETALRHCVENGKIIYVPQVGKNFESAGMELLKVPPPSSNGSGSDGHGQRLFYDTWPKNKWGIPEPPADMPKENAQPGDIDLLVVPGLGFDRMGNRIGQGKGYYDRFIARITTTQDSNNNNNNNKPKLVAVTLDCQLTESVPVSPLDRVMDKILTPSEIIEVTKT